MKRLLFPAVVAAFAVAIPASAEARSCGTQGTTSDGATIKVDAYRAASCSFARATASRFYSVAGVPRYLKVRGTRLTYRGKRRGSRWAYSGRRRGRTVVVIITQRNSAPSPPPTSPPPSSPPLTSPPPMSPPPTSPSPTCDPNYAGACLDPYAFDYDCLGGSGDGPLFTGRVVVVGYDHYGLDRDGDGIGCQ